MISGLVSRFKDSDDDVRCWAVEVIGALARFGKWYYFFPYATAYFGSEDCQTKILEGDTIRPLVSLFGDTFSNVRLFAVEAFSALAAFGKSLCFWNVQ